MLISRFTKKTIMNLYKILVSHHSPKDGHQSLACLLLANSDEQVYEWIKSDPELEHSDGITCSWSGSEDDLDEDTEELKVYDIYDDEYNIIGTENFKEKMIRIKGEINDDEVDFSDAYYGITLYGWDLLNENVDDLDFKSLIDLNIVYKA